MTTFNFPIGSSEYIILLFIYLLSFPPMPGTVNADNISSIRECPSGSFAYSRGKPLSCARSCLGSLVSTVPRRRACLKRFQKASGSCRYLVNSRKECSFVGLRWLVEAAYFSHELPCGLMNLFVRHRRFEVEKGLDVSAHKRYLDVEELANRDADSLPRNDSCVECLVRHLRALLLPS